MIRSARRFAARGVPLAASVVALTLWWSATSPGAAVAATACTGVDRRIAGTDKPALERAISAEMDLPRVELLRSFRYAGWSILYVSTFVTDETFLFYRRDPPRGRSLTRWGGAARMDEGPEIRRWVRANAPGIPQRLTACFARYVTRDRDL